MSQLLKPGSLAKLKLSVQEISSSFSIDDENVVVGGFDPYEQDLVGFHLCDENFEKKIDSIVFVIAITDKNDDSDSVYADNSPKVIILDPASYKVGWVWLEEIESL